MHLLNAARLADDLRHDRLTEREKMGYLVAGAIVVLFFGHASILGSVRSPLGAAAVVLRVAVTVAGIRYCFAANARGDGRSFIERYMCLSLPLAVVWAVAVYALWYGGWALALMAGVRPGRDPRWFTLAYAAVLPLYYLAMARYVARAAAAGRWSDAR